jgi:hypothetical protein
MNETSSLERGYRRVLACYPKSFRRENGDEILAVLVASAKEDQRRVELAECAALIRGGLRMRLRPASRPPRVVRSAVRLMCVGALVELAAVVTMVVTAASVKAALATEPGLTVAQWHTVTGLLTFKEISGGVAVALWLFLAWAMGQRRDVARFTFTAFFALITLTMLIALAQHAAAYAPADLIAGAAIWLVALATMVLIFTRQSNTFYREAARRSLRRPANQAGP